MTLDPVPRWVIAVLGISLRVLLTPLFAFGWAYERYDRATGPARGGGWQRWFAWLPTRLGLLDGPLVWLEPIERVRWGDFYLCRRPGDTSVHAPWEMSDDEG